MRSEDEVRDGALDEIGCLPWKEEGVAESQGDGKFAYDEIPGLLTDLDGQAVPVEYPPSGGEVFPRETMVGEAATTDSSFTGPDLVATSGSSRTSGEKIFGAQCFEGLTLGKLGGRVLQLLLEVVPLRSKTSGGRIGPCVFPLPTSSKVLQHLFPSFSEDALSWMISLCVGLNTVWGDETFCEVVKSDVQRMHLVTLADHVRRIEASREVVEEFDWSRFFRSRTVDYHGEEVKVARHFSWHNISPALPPEIGRVKLQEICRLGSRHYVEHFDDFLLPREAWAPLTRPKVMVKDEDWPQVCKGLLDAGLCVVLPRDEIFDTGEGPLLNGLFGVTKDEWHNGHEVFRLIMKLIPLNGIAMPLQGDVGTLPSWAGMNPFFLQPNEN